MESNYNNVIISGKLDQLSYGYRCSGRNYYKTTIHSRRFSGIADHIPLIIPEELAERAQIVPGEDYIIHARLYSRDEKTSEKPRLRLFLMACKILLVRGEIDCNTVELEGYVCKGPVFRRSKMGTEICQFTVATNYNDKPSYIPCVAFGSTTLQLQNFMIGDKINVAGRVQSREYLTKDFREGITYEVAIKKAVN